eukprot:scaffold200260_cov43-Tisochrysis_lutea.AAC.1
MCNIFLQDSQIFPAFVACLDQERLVMRWASLRDGGALEVGRAILDDPWGEVMGPRGELLREILVPHMDWTSTTWISADGIAYQRTFNPWTDEWAFGDTPKAMGETAVGELTLHVGAQQMRLVRARPPSSPTGRSAEQSVRSRLRGSPETR